MLIMRIMKSCNSTCTCTCTVTCTMYMLHVCINFKAIMHNKLLLYLLKA